MTKNIIANFFGKFWSVFSNFIFIPLYIKFLGFENYSIVSFTLVIAGLMAILDGGLTATLSREFARNDQSILDKILVFKTLEKIYIGISLFSIVLTVFLSSIIASNFANSISIEGNELTRLLQIVSFDIGFQLLMRFYIGGFLGLEKHMKANVIQIIWGVMRNGFVIIVILLSPSLESFFIWQSVITVFFSCITGYLIRNELGINFEIRSIFVIEKRVVLRLWRFASGMLLISIVSALNTQMDKVAISKFLPLKSLGYYTVAISIGMSILVLVNPISTALLPRLTSLFSAGRTVEAKKLYQKVNLFVSIIVFSVMAGVSVFAYELLLLWTGSNDVALNSQNIVPYVSFSFVMLSLAMIPFNIAIANGYTMLNNVLGVVSLLITLPGYWFVTKKYGAVGAAFVYCIVQTMITMVYIYVINNKFFKNINFNSLFIKPIVFPFVISTAIALLVKFVTNNLFINNFLMVIVICFTVLFSVFASVLILFSRSELDSIKMNFTIFKK